MLDHDGRVMVSVYSSGAIGRLVPQDVIGLIRYLREQRLAGRSARLSATDPAASPFGLPRQTGGPSWLRGSAPPPGLLT